MGVTIAVLVVVVGIALFVMYRRTGDWSFLQPRSRASPLPYSRKAKRGKVDAPMEQLDSESAMEVRKILLLRPFKAIFGWKTHAMWRRFPVRRA